MPSLTSRDLNIRNVTHHPRQPPDLRGELLERRLSTSRLSTDANKRNKTNELVEVEQVAELPPHLLFTSRELQMSHAVMSENQIWSSFKHEISSFWSLV